MQTWINFKELRAKLSFKDVLHHYGIETKVKGDRATAFCPLPGHPARTDGKPRTASLSVNLTRNIFQCFGCKKSGNALEFACRMEGFDPSDTEQFRNAALKVAQVFGIETTRPGQDHAPPQSDSDPKLFQSATNSGPTPVVNAVLNFELKDLDSEHPYLPERGFNPETITDFGLGYCNRGLMKGRVAIPLHNNTGRLVGYAGRITKDSMITEECPKYRFPGGRVNKGVTYEFRKSLLLYNLHRVGVGISDLVVVEGFTSTWWLHQCGIPHVVALMGSSCSPEQAKLIVNVTTPKARIWIMPDGNEAGIVCAQSIFEEVAPYRFARWVRLASNEQPTDIPLEKLKTKFHI
jgi:DNA primase